MVETIKAIDASFERLERPFFQALKPLGYSLFIQDLWTGGYEHNAEVKDVAEPNLRDAQAEGFIVAGYSCATPWYSVDQCIRETLTNAGAMWETLNFVADDVEIEGVTETHIIDLALALEFVGKKVCVYTGAWVYNRDGRPPWTGLARFPLWLCQADGQASMDNVHALGPWPTDKIIGKQYDTTNGLLGKEVDLNLFDAAFVRPEEEDMATLEERVKALEDGTMRMAVVVKALHEAAEKHYADKLPHIDSEYLRRLDDLARPSR